MDPFFLLGMMMLAVLPVVIVVATVILIRMKSQRSRLLVQGALLLVLGILALLAATGIEAGRVRDLPPGFGTNVAWVFPRIAVILILGALASWFLSYDFALRRDQEGGTTDNAQ